MIKIIRKFYGVGIVLVVLIALGMTLQMVYFNRVLEKEMVRILNVEGEHVEFSVNAYFSEYEQIVESVAFLVETSEGAAPLLPFMEELLESHPFFSSVYYATEENEMVNGSAWVPPPTFDARVRPWYVKAKAEGALIYTDAFLNASRENWILTIAKPVYYNEDKLMGVVGGDVDISDLLEIIVDIKPSENGLVFIVDEENRVLAHPMLDTSGESEPPMISDIVQFTNFENATVYKSKMLGRRGYMSDRLLPHSNLRAYVFIPESDTVNYYEQLGLIGGIAVLILILITVVFAYRMTHLIFKPVLAISKEVKAIPVDNLLGYRLEQTEGEIYGDLKETINALIQKSEQSAEALQASNSRLEEMLAHLTAVEKDLRANHERLVQSEMRNAAIVNALPDILFRLDYSCRFIDCQVGDERRLIAEKSYFIGKRFDEVLPMEVAKLGEQALKKVKEGGALETFEYALVFPTGKYYFEMRMVPSVNNEVLAIVRDITHQKEHQQRITYLSYHDQLTGLYNRRYYEEILESIHDEAALPISVLMMDVNGLKLTNDAFGHVKGDLLLKSFAKILTTICRPTDIIARVGGDEFVVLLKKTPKSEALKVSNHIYDAIGQMKHDLIVLSASIGVATLDHEEQMMEFVLREAEDLMYAKKVYESQKMRNETIALILKTIDTKAAYEKVHRIRMHAFAERLATFFGLSRQEEEDLEQAILLHDVGKIAISEAVLYKDTALTPLEFKEIMKHPEIGYQLLKSTDAYAPIAEIVLSHHEWWDGTGYPRNLSGNKIPLLSRIISVLEALESMTSERPYKPALTFEEAAVELSKGEGSQFDPYVVGIVNTHMDMISDI